MKLFKSTNPINGENNPNTHKEFNVSRKGILIVDDSRFSRNVLKDILVKENYEVVGEAGDGLEAIEMTKKIHPEYIFMDVEMPKLDGIGAIPRIFAIDSQIHIIMCTALGQKKIAIEAAKAGAVDYITKPYNKDNITNILKMISYSYPNKSKEDNNKTNANILKDKIMTEEHGIIEGGAPTNVISESNETQEFDNINSISNSEDEKLEIANQEKEENEIFNINELRAYIDDSEIEKNNEIQSIVEESEELQKITDKTKTKKEINDVEESNETEKKENEESEKEEIEEAELEKTEEIAKVAEIAVEAEVAEIEKIEEIANEVAEIEVAEETELVELKQHEYISKKDEIEENNEVENKEKLEEEIKIELSNNQDSKIENLMHNEEVVPDINPETIIDNEELNEKIYDLDIESKTKETELAVYSDDIIDSFAVEIEDEETEIVLEGSLNDLHTNNCYKDAATNKQNFSYLWNNRFCSDARNSIVNITENQQVAFSYYTNMKNDINKLFGNDITKKNMMLGMMSAYMPVDNRLQQNEISDFGSDMLRNEDVIRISADKLLNGYLYNITEFSILDILEEDTRSKYNDSDCYNNKKNELSLALGELVNSKNSRMFG